MSQYFAQNSKKLVYLVKSKAKNNNQTQTADNQVELVTKETLMT